MGEISIYDWNIPKINFDPLCAWGMSVEGRDYATRILIRRFQKSFGCVIYRYLKIWIYFNAEIPIYSIISKIEIMNTRLPLWRALYERIIEI